MNESRQVKERWDEASTKSATDCLVKGVIDFLPFGKIQAANAEYVDYRGLVISRAIKSVRLSFLDLSDSEMVLAGQFRFSELEDCKFFRTEEQTNLDQHFVRCDFSRGGLNRACFVGTFEDCSFERTNLRSSMGGAKFIRCNFARANLKGAHLIHAHFDHCNWDGAVFHSGSLASSHFLGTWPAAEALGNTIMRHTKLISD